MLNIVFAIILELANIFGGQQAVDDVEMIVVHIVQVTEQDVANEDTGLTDSQERFMANQYHEINNPENKDKAGFIDISDVEKYLFYQKKSSDRVKDFHNRIDKGEF